MLGGNFQQLKLIYASLYKFGKSVIQRLLLTIQMIHPEH